MRSYFHEIIRYRKEEYKIKQQLFRHGKIERNEKGRFAVYTKIKKDKKTIYESERIIKNETIE